MLDIPAVRPPLMPELATNVLDGSERCVVRIVVEGKVGGGKSAMLWKIHELFKAMGHQVLLEDRYTHDEMQFSQGDDHDKTLRMYSPIIVLQERLTATV